MPPDKSSLYWQDSDLEWQNYWRLAEPHRIAVTQMLLSSRPPDSKLCVWGAGTCHDIDLIRINDHFHQTTLVDIDAKSLYWGIEYQGRPDFSNIKALAPVDLAGSEAWGAVLQAQPFSIALRQLASQIASHELTQFDQYDIVVSTCLLSQIMKAVADLSPQVGPVLLPVFQAVRRKHIQLMVQHLVCGGTGVLITDFLTSEQVPGLADVDDLSGEISKALVAPTQLHLHCLHPQQLHQDLLTHPPISLRIEEVEVSNYWVWRMPHCDFACIALQFTKKKSLGD